MSISLVPLLEQERQSNRLLFVDTDAITTLFYSRFVLTEPEQIVNCEKMAASINAMTQWDLVLFRESDMDFIHGGTRNEIIHREIISMRRLRFFCGYRFKYQTS